MPTRALLLLQLRASGAFSCGSCMQFSRAMLPSRARSAGFRLCFARLFGTRADAPEAIAAALASMLRLPPDADHIVLTDLPAPLSPEAALVALISDASDCSTTRLTALTGCPRQSHRFRAYCSEQFVSANVVEDAPALVLAERIMASRAAATPLPLAIVIRRAVPQRRAAAAAAAVEVEVGPLRDILDRLAPHSFPLHFSFKQHCGGSNSFEREAAAQPSPPGASGLAFRGDVLAFTHRDAVIFRRGCSGEHSDIVVGAGKGGFIDGDAISARFSGPAGIHFDAARGGWLVADALNHRVRCISADLLAVSTVPPQLFARFSPLNSAPATTMPPLQLSHHPLKQRMLLLFRRWASRLNFPPKLSHLLEWIATSWHFGAGKMDFSLRPPLSLRQFSEMARLFRAPDVNFAGHVPLWRPQRISADGAGGCVVVSQGSLFAWRLKAAPVSRPEVRAAAAAGAAAGEQARAIRRQHGVSSFDAALIAAALADGQRGICIGGSLYKLDANSLPECRVQLLATGVVDGALSPSGEPVLSFGPSGEQSTAKPNAR